MSKNPIIISTVDNNIQSDDLQIKDVSYDTKLSQNFLPQTFSASETESESDISESDSEIVDPNDTLEMSKKKSDSNEDGAEDGNDDDDDKFRGRPSSCVFVARYVSC